MSSFIKMLAIQYTYPQATRVKKLKALQIFRQRKIKY